MKKTSQSSGQLPESTAGETKAATVKITPRIPGELFEEASKIAEKRNISRTDVFCELLALGLKTYKNNLLPAVYQSYGKHSLMRAERVAIYVAIMNNEILRELINDHEFIEAAKAKAKDILKNRWDYDVEEKL